MIKVHTIELYYSDRVFGGTTMYLIGMKSLVVVGMVEAAFYLHNGYSPMYVATFDSEDDWCD